MSPEVPAVRTAPDGAVAVELTADQAIVLARVLVHYDALATQLLREGLPVAHGYVPEVWHHTLIKLRTEAMRGLISPSVHRASDTALPPAALKVIAGGAR